ncbi:hypothetical protein L7F22_068056 [Adiantum nelumboides]|nr:hypothetical protein [Adiantum nelumboides]
MPLTRSQRQKAVEGEKDDEVIEKEVVSVPEKKVSLQSGSESEDDGSSSSDTSGSSSSESESSEEEEDLDALFEKSLVALREQDQVRTTTSFADNEDEIRLEGGDQESSKAPKKGIASKQSKKKSRTGLAPKEVESAFQRLERGDELGDDRPKTYRQKQRDNREERSKSIGSKWFGMPAFAGAKTGKKNDENDQKSLINPKGKDGDGRGRSAEEMRREVQAIRLRNAVDPKRFYRGSAKGEMEMPKYAQLGKIISGNADAASTMTRDQRGKSVIDELVKDAESSAYAKRKFNEQQAKTNVGWSSHVRRHQKKKGGVSNKRQRR